MGRPGIRVDPTSIKFYVEWAEHGNHWIANPNVVTKMVARTIDPMNFSGMSSKSIIGRLLRFLLKLIPPEAQMPILQGKLRGKKWIVGSSTHGCWLGSYENEKRILFENTIKPGSVVYDLGGNVGFYTLLSSVLVGPTGRVIVFEPAPRNLLYLKKHLQINHVANVQIIEAAVSDTQGDLLFDEGPNPSMGKIALTGSIRIKAITLDGLFKDGLIPAPNYMKIDIEGAELSALKGSVSILKMAHPSIFLSTHGDENHEECLSLLQSLDYEIFSINQDKDIQQTDEIFAIFYKQ